MVFLMECRYKRSKCGLQLRAQLVPLGSQNEEGIIRFLFRK